METVSPATRLLEKRRLMYEKQEEYESKKKEFKSYNPLIKIQPKVWSGKIVLLDLCILPIEAEEYR